MGQCRREWNTGLPCRWLTDECSAIREFFGKPISSHVCSCSLSLPCRLGISYLMLHVGGGDLSSCMLTKYNSPFMGFLNGESVSILAVELAWISSLWIGQQLKNHARQSGYKGRSRIAKRHFFSIAILQSHQHWMCHRHREQAHSHIF